jgi:hypothetical protein
MIPEAAIRWIKVLVSGFSIESPQAVINSGSIRDSPSLWKFVGYHDVCHAGIPWNSYQGMIRSIYNIEVFHYLICELLPLEVVQY